MSTSRKKSTAKKAAEPTDQLSQVMKEVNKQFGNDTMFVPTNVPKPNIIPSGSFAVDYAMYGGVDEGSVIQLRGWQGAGKTTQALRISAEILKKYPDPEKKVVFVDMEGTLYDSIDWAESIGVDINRLVYVQPTIGEEAIDMIDAVLKADNVLAVVVDSIPALVPQKIAEQTSEADTMALLARLCGKMCSKIVVRRAQARRSGRIPPTVILINQYRASMAMYGSPKTVPGGNQLKYLSSIILDIAKKAEEESTNDSGTKIIDHNVHPFTIVRKKTGTLTKNGEFKMVIDPENPLGQAAIDDNKTVISLTKKFGIVSGGGSSWKCSLVLGDGGEPIKFRTLDDMKTFFDENPDQSNIVKRHLLGIIREKKGLGIMPPDGYLISHT